MHSEDLSSSSHAYNATGLESTFSVLFYFNESRNQTLRECVFVSTLRLEQVAICQCLNTFCPLYNSPQYLEIYSQAVIQCGSASILSVQYILIIALISMVHFAPL